MYLHNVIIEEEMSNASQADLLTTGALEENEHLSMTNILQKALSVKNKYMQEMKKYSLPQTTDADSLLEQYESGEITREKYLEQLKGERTLNPVEIGRMTKEGKEGNKDV